MSNVISYTNKADSLIQAIKKFWKFRGLIWIFTKRDLKVKYAQTSLGLIWTFFKPLLGLFIYAGFFGFILKWKTGDLPFVIYVLSGLLAWNLFVQTTTTGALAAIESKDVIRKIYFPKSILIFAKTTLATIDFCAGLFLFIPLILIYEISFSWNLVFAPFILLYNILIGLSLAFIFALISVRKRDFLQLLPFLLNMGIWLSPVFYTIEILPKKLHFFMELNPLNSLVELWRWTLFDIGEIQIIWLIHPLLTVALFILSFWLFSKIENKFVDEG